MVYSLSMDQFNSDFDQYASAFRLAQAQSGIDLDSILVDTLQQGVTNQLAVMMTATALLEGQDKTGWKWNNGLIRQESSTKMWYNSGNSKVGETVSFRWLKQLEPLDHLGTPTPWM